MRQAINTFKGLLYQAEISEGLYQYLKSQKIPIDSSDLLRWQWVLAVSSLDKYVHDIVRIGMMNIFEGERIQTPKYKTFHIDMNVLSTISTAPVPVVEFEKEVVRQHSHLAFQFPDKIAEALAYIWDASNKWEIISHHMQTAITPIDLKTKLKNIVIRRNQIVHQGDCMLMTMPLQQQDISLTDTQDVINFIEELVKALDNSIPV